jgi:carbon-monoxide dehydrogenase large subunit
LALEVVGTAVPRVDGAEKVTGTAKYTADLPLTGALWGKTLHSPYAHALIKHIDTSEAAALPGVFAVITGADVGEGLFGSNLRDLTVLARDRVRFIGERVAAVAAIDEDTAQAALDLIEVEYEELAAVFEIDEALAPGAPILHPDWNTYPGVTETPGPGPFGGHKPLATPSNLYTHRFHDRGDLEAGFAEADVIVENTYQTQRQHQGYLEPHVCVVDIDDAGRVLLWAGSKMPHGARGGLAQAVGIAPQQILVQHTFIGGDFGGKGSSILFPIAYFLALKTGRPIRMVNEYLEELLAGNPRHAVEITIRTGIKQDGTMTAHHARFVVNSGAYAAHKPGGVIFGPEQSVGPYKVANSRFEGMHVYTNTVPGGYMRGPGESQAVFALESHIDECAKAAGIDPVAFRMKNLVGEGDETAFGVTFDGTRAHETLQAAVDAAGYKSNPSHGYGVAIGERPAGGGVGNSGIKFTPEGIVVVGTPIFDQGSGTYTIIMQIVSEELQVPFERIRLEVWDTDAVPFDSGIAGSWAARVNTGAVHDGIAAARKELLGFAARQLELPEDSLSLDGDDIVSTHGERVGWAELLQRTGESIEGRATYSTGMGQLAHITGFCAQVAEVEVDAETGEFKLVNFTTSHDVGRVLNPNGHQGQINGGIVQGFGYALMEELRVEDGRVTNLSLGDYKLPTTRDLPPLTTVLLSESEGQGPYSIKAIGEVPTTPVAPAIANAIADVSGARVRDLPVTAEKVYRELR